MKRVKIAGGYEFRLYSPKDIKKHLDENIIGQEEAKKVLSVAVYNHYKRVYLYHNGGKMPIDKSNILMAGPTGCGKTAMIKSVAELIDVPFYIADATTLTEAGYVGDDVESILVGLMRNCNSNKLKAQVGMIAIDEIDKISKRGSNEHISRDVVGEGVQQALLKMVEGNLVGIPPVEGRKHPEMPLNYIDTKNILFIGMGAFSGISDIIERRMRVNKLGFVNSDESKVDYYNGKPFEYMCQEDLIEYGMIPEFIGRFPVITSVNNLERNDLMKILIEPKNSIFNQYREMLEFDNINLRISDNALGLLADLAIEIGTGARGLRSLFESIMTDIIFENATVEDDNSEKNVLITPKLIRSHIDKRFTKYLDAASKSKEK